MSDDEMNDPLLLEGNTAFYKAFESRDLSAMTKLWDTTADVFCVHPGWPMLIGWDNVVQSWYTLFSNTQRLQFVVTETRSWKTAGMGFVSCTESLLDRGAEGSLRSINSFRFDDFQGMWKMTGHITTTSG